MLGESLTTMCSYLDVIDLLNGEVCEPEENVRPPQSELGDEIAVRVDGQRVQTPQGRQRVDLLQTVDVGFGELQTLHRKQCKAFVSPTGQVWDQSRILGTRLPSPGLGLGFGLG